MPDIRSKEHRESWNALIRVARHGLSEGRGTIIADMKVLVAASDQLDAYEHAELILRKPCTHNWVTMTVGGSTIRMRECKRCGAHEEIAS